MLQPHGAKQDQVSEAYPGEGVSDGDSQPCQERKQQGKLVVTELAEPQAPCTPFYHSGVDAMLKNKQPAFIAISLLRTIPCKQPPATGDGHPRPKTLPDLHFPPPFFSFFSCRLRLSFPLGIKCLSSRVRPAEHGPGTPGRPPPPAACDRQSHSPRHRPRPRFFGGDHLFAPSPLPAPRSGR